MNVFTLWFLGIVGWASLTILIGVPRQILQLEQQLVPLQ
jgi:hypothetical protein